MTTNTTSSRGRMGRSRLPGKPTVVPAVGGVAAAPQQLSFPTEPGPAGASGEFIVEGSAGVAIARHEVLPAVVHIPGWLGPAAQRRLVEDFRGWALPPAGLRHPRVPAGHLMSVQSVCLGWHWQPYAYSKTADDTDGAPVKPLPDALADLGRAAVVAAYGNTPGTTETDAATCLRNAAESTVAAAGGGASYRPDAAIVNLYAPGARLGLHQDGEEPSPAPVVTISLGDTCVFRLAGVGRRTGPFTDIALASGDLLVFGGPSRRIYHGVPKVLNGTGPSSLGLPPGRLSITLRETGLGMCRSGPR